MRLHGNRCLVIAPGDPFLSALERSRKLVTGIVFSLLSTAESAYVLTLYIHPLNCPLSCTFDN